MKWISVEDKLPSDAKEVIAYTPRGYEMASYDGDGWYLEQGYHEMGDKNDEKMMPTHWLKFPPKE